MEQPPAFVTVESFGHARKSEPAGQELGIDSQQARLQRPVQVQAIRHVSLANTHWDHVDAGHLPCVQGIEIAPGTGVQVLHHGHRGLPDEGETACAGIAPGRVAICIQAKHAHGSDQKASAG
jgi:hypothetical protein